MARQRRQYGSPRSRLSTEERQRIINDYMAETGAEEVNMVEVARWAQANGRMPPPRPYDPVRVFAHELSEAAREEYYTDPQGRDVRRKHCYVIVEPDGQRRFQWVDIETARPGPMHRSLQARRRQAFGDIVQLDTDRQSYNENNPHGAHIEMSYNFDEDLAERNMPTEYPDEPPEEGDDAGPPTNS